MKKFLLLPIIFILGCSNFIHQSSESDIKKSKLRRIMDCDLGVICYVLENESLYCIRFKKEDLIDICKNRDE